MVKLCGNYCFHDVVENEKKKTQSNVYANKKQHKIIYSSSFQAEINVLIKNLFVRQVKTQMK